MPDELDFAPVPDTQAWVAWARRIGPAGRWNMLAEFPCWQQGSRYLQLYLRRQAFFSGVLQRPGERPDRLPSGGAPR